ncbi:MAG: ABC transporter substrate-binding protein [Mycobacteriales bacterium]
MNRRLAGLFLSTLILAVLGCVSCTSTRTSSAPARVEIGLLAPLSGPQAAAGTRRLNAARLAIDLLNRHQGPPIAGIAAIGATRFVLRVADSASDPDRSEEQARRLAVSGVAGIVSADDAQDTQRAAPAAQDRLVPLLAAVATADYLDELADPVLYRVCPTDSQLAQILIELAQHQLRHSPRIAVISTGPEDADVVDSLTSQAVAADAPVVAVESGEQDTTAAIHQLVAAAPDVVFAIAPTGPQATDLLTAVARRGVGVVFGLGEGFTTPGLTNTSGATLVRAVAWSSDPASHNQFTSTVASTYQHRYNTSMTADAAQTLASVLVLANAIGQARSAVPGKVTQALAGLNLDALGLPVPWALEFSAGHDNTHAGGVAEILGAGTTRSVYPPELASRPPPTLAASATAAADTHPGGRFRRRGPTVLDALGWGFVAAPA